MTAFIVSCNSATEKQSSSQDKTIEVLSPEQMQVALKELPEAQLIDVRRANEYKVSHLKEAQNICVTDSDFKDKVASLDPKKPVYVYCKKGGRSAKAATILKDMGFTKIYDLQGGITNWEKNELEVAQ